jgi:hypothetical protein
VASFSSNLWRQKFRGNLHEQFSQEDIPNIRIQIMNDLLMSEHNKADWDVVRNYDGSVSVVLVDLLHI